MKKPSAQKSADKPLERRLAVLSDSEALSLFPFFAPVDFDPACDDCMRLLIAAIPSAKAGRKKVLAVLPVGRTEEECLAIAKGLGLKMWPEGSLVETVYVRRDGMIVGNETDREIIVKILCHDEEPGTDGAVRFWADWLRLGPLDKWRAPAGSKILYVVPASWSADEISELMTGSGRFLPMTAEKREECVKKSAKAN